LKEYPMQPTYFGHPVFIIRRGAKNTRIRFVSGRQKLVPTSDVRYKPISAA